MIITWLGHAAFLLESKGLRIVNDPYDASDSRIKYRPISMAADIVTVSHEHFDHNFVAGLTSSPEIIRGTGTKVVKGVCFTGISTYHDDNQGKERGENTVFIIETEDLRVCHLGDLGHILSPDQSRAIGPIDILLLPVGGLYTIDAVVAWQVAQDLAPKLVIPMHFKTISLDFPIASVDGFLEGKRGFRRIALSSIEVTKKTLPKNQQIYILEHKL